MDEDLHTGSGPSTLPPWPAPWPCAWTDPPFPPADREALGVLREGDHESDEVEALAVVTAGARGAIDVAIGDGLVAMRKRDRLMSLGFSSLSDYAREVLGIGERKAQDMAHLSAELRTRPQLRAAVCAGEVRTRRAETVLPVAVGEAEREWVELAKALTVGTLEDLVRSARASQEHQEEEWRRVRIQLTPEERAIVDRALDVAGKLLGAESTRGSQLEAMAQEYVGEHPQEAGDRGSVSVESFRRVGEDLRLRREAALEAETERWSLLRKVGNPAVPGAAFDDDASAQDIDAELRRLVAMRSGWDGTLGHTALSVKASGLWKILGFASFSHWAAERLGLAKRTAEQRVALERRLWDVPALRDAFNEKRLSYEQARLLSRLPDGEIPGWIPRAEELTCIELRRALEAEEEAQLRAAGSLVARVPSVLAVLLTAAFEAARAVEDEPWWSDGKCLVAIARHFLEVWEPQLPRRKTRSQRIRERDLGCCQVPGCSRRATHAHHITPRSQGGTDHPSNLVALCTCHHLFGIHGGYIRVTGTAPDGLEWTLGGRVWMGVRRGG